MTFSMEDEDFSSLAEHVLNKELYEESSPVYDEGCSPETEVPFTLLHGESPTNFTLSTNEEHLFVLTNYRLFASLEDGFYSVPLGLIECSELRHPTDLMVLCKDCRSCKLPFESEAQAYRWLERIHQAIKPKPNFSDMFAFIHYAHKLDSVTTKGAIRTDNSGITGAGLVTLEYQRMGMGLSEMWRITECNTKYKVCSSYPKLFVVPRAVSDSDLVEVAKFRALGRVPAVVWRHSGNGCFLVRCSQPLVGVLGWRCHEDEKLFHALARSCTSRGPPPPGEIMQREDTPISNGHAHIATPSLLILDLRSYTAALGNRAKGGGCEHQDYYHNCEIRYKGLANIHSVRKSFASLRTLLNQNSLSLNFHSSLETTQWILHISQLLSTAAEIVSTIHLDNRPVVVHCSDGWDRTPQVVALAEILLDPYYRTFEGFRVLVEREWLSFGHKFSDRCGLGVDSEQSPIFVQWLDCVYQLMQQFPTVFEFNVSYLIKLAHHSYSLMCGTFLLNCEQHREEHKLSKHTLSLWNILASQDNQHLVNVFYRNEDEKDVLFPSWYPKDLSFWRELYDSSHLIPYTSTASHLPRNSVTPICVSPQNCFHNGNSDTNGYDLAANDPNSSIPVTIKGTNETINNSNHSSSPVNNRTVFNSKNEDSFLNPEDNNTPSRNGISNGSPPSNLIQSNMFHSFHLEASDNSPPLPDGITTNGTIIQSNNSLPPSHLVNDMEDSFRIVEDVSEPSLTTKSINKPLARLSSSNDPALTPISSTDTDIWSTVIIPERRNKMNMSQFSECESRLRNLAEDGMKPYQDPVQERVREIEEQYKERIARLEEKMKRVSTVLRHKMDSSERKEEGEEELLEFITESSDNIEQPSSPDGNGWTHVGMEDAVGVQWIPDHAVTHCKLCGDEFWLGKRKHHCRNCGGVFCWKCSNFYCPVPMEQLYVEQRVCRRCFDRLDGHLHYSQQQNDSTR